MPSAGNASPMNSRVLAGHDLEQRALAGAVEAEDADLRAGQKREPDVLEEASECFHRVDVLHRSSRWVPEP